MSTTVGQPDCITVGQSILNSLEVWNGKTKFNLENIKTALINLNLDNKLKNLVHIAGTNGKGSTSCIIASILNKSVGLNISPHLVDVRERISIDGKLIDKEIFYNRVIDINERIPVKLSYHEFLTVLAISFFYKLDYQVLEVGLGGLYDASNVIENPKICIITSISYDHVNVLGNTIEEIALQKAGIIKEGCKLIIGLLPNEAKKVVLLKAKEKNVQTFILNEDFKVLNNKFYYSNYEIVIPSNNLLGKHQINNIACAIMAGILLDINQNQITNGVKQVKWPGRLEKICYKNKNFLLDAAHNEESVESLISFLDNDKIYETIVFGVIQTKDWKLIVDKLIPYIVHWNIVEPESDISVSCEDIYDYLLSKGIHSKVYKKNYENLLSEIEDNFVLVTGSIYLLGAIRKIIKNEEIEYF